MSEEIKSCPFCGSSDVKVVNGHVTCQNCGSNAVKMAWNNRYEDHDNLIFCIRKLKRLLIIKNGARSDRFQRFPDFVDQCILLSDKSADEMAEEIIKYIGYTYNEYHGDYLHYKLPWENMGK